MRITKTPTFGSSVRKARDKHCYFQKTLAELLGVETALLSAWERDFVLPDKEQFAKHVEFLPELADVELPEKPQVSAYIISQDSAVGKTNENSKATADENAFLPSNITRRILALSERDRNIIRAAVLAMVKAAEK